MVPDGEKLKSTTVTDTDALTLPDFYEPPAPVEYPSGITLALIIISLSISVFLCAMDETIIVTAIPKITDEFHSLQDVGWYGSAYFMTFATFQLIYGKLFTLYPIKTIFTLAIVIFEAGSTICGSAPSSPVFIFGRALAGLGSAGINAGFIIILAASLPLERRPLFVPCYTAMYGLAAVVAPLLGGALASSKAPWGWRWCFYLNLPLGGCALFVLLVSCRLSSDSDGRSRATQSMASWKEKVSEMDFPGTGILIPSLVCLLLALQWGSALQYPWDGAVIISLLVVSGIGLVSFLAWEVYKGESGTLPPRIIKQRSIACSAGFVFFGSGTVNIFQYYLPIWFQAIQNITPLESGIRILPTTLSIAVFSFFSGLGVAKTGYYTPFIIAGAAMLTAGALFAGTALTVFSPAGIWVSCQLVYGIGAGIGLQQAHTAAQTVLSPTDLPMGVVILIFAHVMGSVVFVPVAQSIFTGQLLSGILREQEQLGSNSRIIGFNNPKEILDMGANGFRQLPFVRDGNPDVLERLLEVYNLALTRVFLSAGAIAAAALIVSSGMEWVSIKKKTATSHTSL